MGTAQFEDFGISESGVPHTGPKLTFKLEGPVNASVNGKDYATLTVGTTWKFNGGESGLIGRDQLDLDERFKRTQRTPALLYDDQMCRAFLVSELSIVLHMVSTHLRKDSLLRNRKIPYAVASADGGAATYEAVKDAQHLMVPFGIGGPRKYTDIVDDFITIIQQRKLQTALRRQQAEVSLKVGLRGWDGGGKVIISIDYNYGYRFLYAGVKRLKSSPAWGIRILPCILSPLGGRCLSVPVSRPCL